ncbi:MAG: hypothetical protein AAFU38_01795 [Bacteroidota bacterium]
MMGPSSGVFVLSMPPWDGAERPTGKVFRVRYRSRWRSTTWLPAR